ncbi:hypothetical protein FB387_006549 [Streptomyces cinereoruber]|nr:hypothetical protein [Streptomyces cinereoruber]NIH65315.1 hypothetical protein [Streptomyces cinereoruber]
MRSRTARLVCEQLNGVALRSCETVGGYTPYMQQREELPPESADAVVGHLARFPAGEREKGPEPARAALARFTRPCRW